MKTFPLINGPVGGLMFGASKTPPETLRCVQTFRDCAVTDFYKFDPRRRGYVWEANNYQLACSISVMPARPNA